MLPLVKFKLVHPGAQLPKRGTDGAGGFDFFAPVGGRILAGEKILFGSGIAHDLPGGLIIRAYQDGAPSFVESAPLLIPMRFQGVLFDRSSLGHKKGIRISFASLIDNDYRGEIKLSIENASNEDFTWEAGERLCQICYMLMYTGDAEETKALDETARGAGGFGSTGK